MKERRETPLHSNRSLNSSECKSKDMPEQQTLVRETCVYLNKLNTAEPKALQDYHSTMDTPKFLFLYLLFILITSSAATGVVVPTKHQTFHLSRKQQAQGNNPVTVTVQPTPPLATVPPLNATPPPPTTTAVSPPTTTTPPAAGAGQSWCVAKAGAPTASVQAGLDYACGAGAECTAIQQGGSCYNPNALQNHASYAFNSYYQKRSRQTTSCDFNGAAQIVNVNPSSGSCVYPTLSSSTSPSTTTPMTPPSSGSLPAPPTNGNSSDLGGTTSTGLQQPFLSCIILLATIITVLDI